MHKRDINWQLVSQQLFRAIRGSRSQVFFSRRLGYAGRPAADWERGRRFPAPSVLFRAAAIAGVDSAEVLRCFHPPAAHAADDLSDAGIGAWLNALRGETSIVTLASRSGFHRSSVSRWLSGDTRPRVHQFLALVDAITDRAAELVGNLVEIDLIPALKDVVTRRDAAKKLAYEEPWTAAVLRLLETSTYTNFTDHPGGWLSQQLRIDLQAELRCLQKLEEAGMVSVDEETGKYTSTPLTVDAHEPPERMVELKTHWTNVAKDRIANPDQDELFAFNVMSLSECDYDQVRELLTNTFHEIQRIVGDSAPIETAALVQLQLVSWKPRPGERE